MKDPDVKSLALVNRNVRKGKFDSGMEVMANNYTKVQNSPKRFKLDDVRNLLDASCSALKCSGCVFWIFGCEPTY